MLFYLLLLIASSHALTPDEIQSFQARPYVEGNTGVQGTVSIIDNGQGVLTIKSNGIPDHPTGAFDGSRAYPNYIQPQNNIFKIPKSPSIAASSTCAPMGTIGVAINGVSIFNPYSMGCCNAGEEELNLFDYCWGHPAPGNIYHYHIGSSCNYQLECGVPSGIDKNSMLSNRGDVGVALDGFPIYGPNDEDGTQLMSQDLDECHGKFASDGSYRYHITADFPFYIGCFRGTPLSNSGMVNGCQCEEVVEVCTEFGGGGGPPPPPRPRFSSSSGKEIKNLSDLLKLTNDGKFECCVDPTDCDYVYNVDTGIPNSG
ncbi:uncharacterized protein LOC144751910 [Ciona intestinalis]